MRHRSPQDRHLTRPRGGFTLIELLVVIGILVVLAAILIPTISHIRTSAHQSGTASRVQSLMNAIDNYYHEFTAYPGPAPDNELKTALNLNSPPKLLNNAANSISLTGTENLTVGLMGGLHFTPAKDGLIFLPEECGKGALGLNPFKPAQRYGPYIEAKVGGLEPQTSTNTWVKWSDPAHSVESGVPHQMLFMDTAIPEFTDAYPDAMPILYQRSVLGASGSITGAVDSGGGTVTATNAAYDPGQLQVYVFPAVADTAATTVAITNNVIGANADPQVYIDFASATAPITSPANYFGQYSAPAVPRFSSYLLITAGPDRKYMTKDDTINNGSAVK